MKNLDLAFHAAIAAFLPTMLLFSSGGAHAADGCAMVGIFDSRAKALCEQALKAAPTAAPIGQIPPTGAAGQPPASTGQAGAPGAVSQAPVPAPSQAPPMTTAVVGSQRFDVVKGGLYIDVPGTGFPPGYAPAWAVTSKPQTISAARLVGRATDQKRISIGFGSADGHPVLTFDIGGGFGTCTADLTGLPQAITTTPKRFELTNIRGANRYCTPESYSGWVSLSTDSAGDILASVDLTTSLGKSANQMRFVATDAKFENVRPQQWAQGQAAQKAQQAVIDAKLREEDEAKLGHKLSPLEQTLALDWDSGLTQSESAGMAQHPQDYAELCLQRNPRACFAVKETINNSRVDDDLIQYPSTWSKAAAQSISAGMREVCLSQKTVKDHAGYCYAMDTINYAMIAVYGPKEQDLRHCLAINPTSTASQKVYVDGYGNKSYGSVQHQITGNDLENVCAFTVVFSTGSAERPLTLKPNEAIHLEIGFLGSMFNMNTLYFHWIKKQ